MAYRFNLMEHIGNVSSISANQKVLCFDAMNFQYCSARCHKTPFVPLYRQMF